MSRTAALPQVSAPFAWRADDGLTWLTAEVGPGLAAFSTRLGGVSEGPYESLNLGILTEDVRERVLANRAALARALGREPDSIAMGRQVHGVDVQVRDRLTAGARLAEVDAQVTTSPALTPLVLVADCVPLVLAAAGAVAAVHCGWRGVAGGIVRRAVDAVRAHGDGPVSAAVGPGIGPCCYDVGPEVVERFAERGHVQRDTRLDLPKCVAVELERAGVEGVALAGVCVSCNAELFFSHRRDGGITGRQAGLAWLAS